MIVYSIDRTDRIILVNVGWNRFAGENEASHLIGDRVLNRPLWEFISDAETRHLNQTLVARVRAKQVPLVLPFRCDSPSIRRYMTMEIVPRSDDAIEYCCSVTRIEHRAPVSLLEAKERRDQRLLRMCSWCKKVDTGNNIWMEVEAAIEALRLFERKRLPEISHTMCDECLRNLEDSTPE